jgi:hypothetical protein
MWLPLYRNNLLPPFSDRKFRWQGFSKMLVTSYDNISHNPEDLGVRRKTV